MDQTAPLELKLDKYQVGEVSCPRVAASRERPVKLDCRVSALYPGRLRVMIAVGACPCPSVPGPRVPIKTGGEAGLRSDVRLVGTACVAITSKVHRLSLLRRRRTMRQECSTHVHFIYELG
jgi:hypothetical protein